MDFLADREPRPVTLAAADGLRAEGLFLGNGASALEVLVTSASSKPSIPSLRSVWKARVGGPVTPVLLVTLYGDKAAIGLGSIYNKGNETVQYNLSADVNYPRKRWSASASYNSNLSSSARWLISNNGQ